MQELEKVWRSPRRSAHTGACSQGQALGPPGRGGGGRWPGPSSTATQPASTTAVTARPPAIFANEKNGMKLLLLRSRPACERAGFAFDPGSVIFGNPLSREA